MTAARIARRQQAAPAPRRDPIAFLLLTRIDVTNARPWIGFAGLAACWVLCALLEGAP
jgi:hypothetical protein